MKFISKELAIKLKEKGFDKPCFNAYNVHGCQYVNGWCEYLDERDNDLIHLSDLHNRDCLCPTIDQVLEWLREEKNVHIGIMLYFTMSTKNNIMWQWEILLIGKIIECKNTLYIDKDYNYTKLASADYYASYDDACVYAIEFVVNNLI